MPRQWCALIQAPLRAYVLRIVQAEMRRVDQANTAYIRTAYIRTAMKHSPAAPSSGLPLVRPDSG